MENLEDLELDFLDEDILECDNMRGLIQVFFYTEMDAKLNSQSFQKVLIGPEKKVGQIFSKGIKKRRPGC